MTTAWKHLHAIKATLASFEKKFNLIIEIMKPERILTLYEMHNREFGQKHL